jgi:hypothetical protein
VLEGEARPRDADEGLGFARVCRFKGMHATATRLYAEAFAAGAKPATSRWRSDRSDAARSAALTAAGQAKGARGLDDDHRAELRQQALGWLKAELKDLERAFEKDSAKARPVLAEVLRWWQRAPDLAGLRDEEALARLPETEARACRDFWNEVAALLAR